MKFKIILLLLGLIFVNNLNLYSQEKNEDCKKDESMLKYEKPEYNDGKIFIQRVICEPELSKDEIYLSAREFFTNNFNCGECVLDLEDKENGVMIGKGNIFSHRFKHLSTINIYLHFTIKIECKNGRYRFTLYNFQQSTVNAQNIKTSVENIFDPAWKMGKKARKQQQSGFLNTFESLRKLIIHEIRKEEKDSDW